ncbi:hypothetical protein AKJ09_05516 [Labilithrix luteola]|uniref:Multiple EGF-like-domain protein 3 n=1 Tax=Labilithrix luteola TaxID=1391654 RepID=A0A0K1PZD1_9BACT|nr:DUF4215 domain-containing protein [Labilithrix luteola]AKU98852.1 hypothetical protein AKJ09_05516 [Labilithrix luteola]
MFSKIFESPRLAVRALFPTVALVSIVAACSTSLDDASVDDFPPDAGPDAPTSTPNDAAHPSPTGDSGTSETSTGGPTCGNRKLESGEQCDDGNTQNNDGCSADCKIESAGPEDVCDGAPLTLTHEDGSTLYTGQILGSTAKLYNHYSSSCGGGSGADAVYKIESPMVGRATVRLSAGFEAIVSVRSTCEDVKTEIACAETSTDAGANRELLSFPVYPGSPIYLMVDGYGGAKGEFTLDVQVQTAFCGNGKAEHPEECDDGNTNDGDGCSKDCMLEDSASVSTCPGMGYRLAASAATPGTISFAGDTTSMTNPSSYGSSVGCSPAGAGPNAIYAITPTINGSLTVNLLANYPKAVLHVRRECSDTTTQVDCAVGDTNLTPTNVSIPVSAEQTVYMFVDGDTSSKGMYTVEAKLTAAACGNGYVDATEECDDGNTTAGDGCSDTCKVERDSASYTCPGKPLRLEAANAAGDTRSLTLRGITTPLPGESLPASKVATCGTAAPDVVYAVTSDIDGYMTATVTGSTFPVGLSVRSACPGTADVACDKTSNGNGKKTIRFAVNKETPYYLFVDGNSATRSGSFVLDLALNRSVCGNGVIEGGETCDDGATDDGDGCDHSCKLETDLSRDECATAPEFTFTDKADGTKAATIVSGTTNLTHTAGVTHSISPCSSIGFDGHYPFIAPIDGVVTATMASATFKASFGVRSNCTTGTPIACDGATGVGGYEITFPVTQGTRYDLIVSGVSYNSIPQFGRFTMNVKLSPAGCGDTFVSGGEACDDGNTKNGDGCSSTCTIESIPGIDSCPGLDLPLSGTGTQVRSAVVTVNTVPLNSKYASACGGSGNEGIIKITPDIDGQLQVKSTSNFSTLIYARASCNDANSEIPRASCTSSTGSYATAVTKGTPYYIFVDGLGGQSGLAQLKITVTP